MPKRCIKKTSNAVKNHFHVNYHPKYPVVIIDESSPHISLSKPFYLRSHHIPMFHDKLKGSLNHVKKYNISYFVLLYL